MVISIKLIFLVIKINQNKINYQGIKLIKHEHYNTQYWKGLVIQPLLEIVGVTIDMTFLKINLTMYPEIATYKKFIHIQVKAVILFPEICSMEIIKRVFLFNDFIVALFLIENLKRYKYKYKGIVKSTWYN